MLARRLKTQNLFSQRHVSFTFIDREDDKVVDYVSFNQNM
jgi:hypothetical protein